MKMKNILGFLFIGVLRAEQIITISSHSTNNNVSCWSGKAGWTFIGLIVGAMIGVGIERSYLKDQEDSKENEKTKSLDKLTSRINIAQDEINKLKDEHKELNQGQTSEEKTSKLNAIQNSIDEKEKTIAELKILKEAVARNFDTMLKSLDDLLEEKVDSPVQKPSDAIAEGNESKLEETASHHNENMRAMHARIEALSRKTNEVSLMLKN